MLLAGDSNPFEQEVDRETKVSNDCGTSLYWGAPLSIGGTSLYWAYLSIVAASLYCIGGTWVCVPLSLLGNLSLYWGLLY